MKTLKEVEKAASIIRETFDHDARLGPAYENVLKRYGPIEGRDFVAALLVALGRAIPETALLKCPAADYLITLDHESQWQHVAKGKPFELLSSDLKTVTRKSYNQLTAKDCEQLFVPGGATMVREMAEALNNGDDMQLFFRGKEFTGKVVRRSKS